MARGRARWGQRWVRRHPSAFLLAAQLLSLLLYPAIDESNHGRWVFGAIGLVVLPLAVWVVSRSAYVNLVAWLLAVPAVLLTVASAAWNEPALMPACALLESALYFYAAGSLITYMLRDASVSTDDLFAAGATFTLLAWGFAYAFYLCQVWYPASFVGMVEPERQRTWMELLFLSFTNLSAVGVSDIVPVGSPARVLVMLEQFAGVGYIATVVSHLIGMRIQQRR
jgi:hypothetical protein